MPTISYNMCRESSIFQVVVISGKNELIAAWSGTPAGALIDLLQKCFECQTVKRRIITSDNMFSNVNKSVLFGVLIFFTAVDL